ncbi:hypothetical protein ACFOEZ_12825 [Tianweitania populi]|uniref:Uncharacterized protein n=1 Tax=Tianweitania populi TaxID=1607949 RepID=A0A8J3DRK6_9HYPH|nr:hypothetical protein [Tianweitania populi]GHD19632.1 hypothetical protein GCM10016234_31540 [Tianweitania populi]
MHNPGDPRAKLITAEQQGCLVQALASAEMRAQQVELSEILCDLHNASFINLASDHNLAAIDALDHNDFWIVMHPLDKAIAGLVCSHLDVLKLVHRLVLKAGSDGAAGLPNISLVTWCKNNPAKAREIVEGVKELDDLCLAHGVFAVVGLGDEALAFDLIRQSNTSVVSIGLRAIGRVETVSSVGIRQGVDDASKVIEGQIDAETRIAAIEAAFRLWEKLGSGEDYRQQEFIESIGKTGDPTELSVLSGMLFFHDKGLSKESIDQVLGLLERIPSNSVATLHNLDHAIKDNDDRWDFHRVAGVFATCIPRLDEKARKKDYYSFSKWVWRKPDHSSYLFSKWLSGGEFTLCSFLADLLSADDKGAEVWLQKNHLPLDLHDQKFLAQKCIGFLWHHEVTAASVLLSIVKNGEPKARVEAEKLLLNPLLLSYGGDLRIFVEAQCSNASKRISECAKRLISKHDTHIADLERAQSLVELLPPIEHRRAVAIKDRDRNRDIQKHAHEQSIFARLATRQTLLYGRKSFSIIHGAEGKKHPNISPLSEFSHSIELPRLMVVDPVGFNAMIFMFRAKTRKPS